MKKINWKQILILAGTIFSALFLTILVDRITLTTLMHKIFVFGYFYIILFIITESVLKQQIERKRSFLIIILSVIFSISFVKIGGFDNYYKRMDLEISPVGRVNENSYGEEVWVKDIIVDNSSIFYSDYYDFSGWYKDNDSGYFVSYNEEKTEPFHLSIKYINDCKIIFIKHQWSGAAEVLINGKAEQCDLYAEKGEDIEFTYGKEYGEKNLSWENTLIIAAGFILFFQLIFILFVFAFQRNLEIALGVFLCSTGIFWDGLCQSVTYICITILGIIWSYIIKQDLDRTKYLNKYKKCSAAILLIALYSTFSIVGRKTFLYNGKHSLSIFFLCIVCFFVILEIIIFMEKIVKNKGRIRKENNNFEILKSRDRIFFIIKNTGLSIFFAFILLFLLDDFIIKEYQNCEVNIEALAENGQVSENNEVLLDAIHIDGQRVDSFHYVSSIEGGWKEFGENSFIYNQSDKVSNLQLQFPASRKIELFFYNYSQGGKARIKDGKNEKIIDFSSTDENYIDNFYIYQVESNKKQMDYRIRYFVYFTLFFIILFVLISSQDFFLYKKEGKRLRIQQKYLYWTCWFIIFTGLNVVCYAYFPGNWTWDNLFQWAQATDMVELSDGHPIIMTLFLKFLLEIYKHPYMLQESVILLVATVFATIYTYLFENGISRKIAILLSVFTMLSPALIIMSVNLLKDSFHMCFMALTVFYFYVLLKTPKYFKRPYYYIGLIITLFMVSQLRHEAMVSFIACSVFIFFCSIIKREYFVVGTVIIATVFIYGFRCYQDTLLSDKTDSKSTAITLLLCDMSRVLYDGNSLTEESSELMKEYLPLEQWQELYNPYDRDTISFCPEYELALEQNGEISLTTVLKNYIKEFFKNPASIIRARLDAVDTMWNVADNKEADIFYGRDGIMTFYCVGPKELGFQADENGTYKAENFISKIVKPVIESIKENHLLTILFLNVGITIIACFIMLQYLWKNDRELIFIFFPVIIRIFTMLLTAGWQHFRYYYSIRLMIVVGLLLCVFHSIYCRKSENFCKEK